MSIDLGFAHADLGDGAPVWLRRRARHDRFIRNMAAGVAAIDVALLAVAADDGPMPQTHEHVAILEWLGVPRCVVALTKIDRVDGAAPPRREPRSRRCSRPRGSDVRRSSTSRRRSASASMRCASRCGQPPPMSVRSAFRAPPLRCRSPVHARRRRHDRHRHGRRRRLVVGATLSVSPHGATVRVRGIEVHGRAVDAARAGERCALNLAGADRAGPRSRAATGSWTRLRMRRPSASMCGSAQPGTSTDRSATTRRCSCISAR